MEKFGFSGIIIYGICFVYLYGYSREERNFLIKVLQKKLKDMGRSFGIDFTFVDMRWGVRDENTLDHLTWLSCLRELERCEEESLGIFFLSLQSHKYGYCPLPKFIPKSNFESKSEDPTLTPEWFSFAHEWYSLDTNALPDGRYVLKNLSSMDDEQYWNKALPVLVKGMDGLQFDTDRPYLFIGDSVTSNEVKAAFSFVSDNRMQDRLAWLNRTFETGVTKEEVNAKWWEYDDTMGKSDTTHKFSGLIDWMKTEFSLVPQDNVKKYSEALFSDYANKTAAWNIQFQRFQKEATSLFETCMSRAIETRKAWDLDGCDLGIPGNELSEMLHHYEWAFTKCADFHGREPLIQEALDIILARPSPVDPPSQSSADHGGDYEIDGCGNVFSHDCINLSVIGKSGSGKTALMSKLAQVIKQLSPLPVIIRYCGTSPGSVSGASLILSICHQLHYLMGKEWNEGGISDLPYDDLVRYFHELLHDFPVILFIDSLDQLSNDNLARSHISFLKDCTSRPHEDTRIIVSTLPDELDPTDASGKKWVYFYGCESKLKISNVPRVELTLHSVDSIDIIKSLLNRKNRTLTKEQWLVVSNAIEKENTALYLQLAVRVVQSWTSSISEPVLAGGVRNLINQIFEGLERSLGRELTRAAFGFITFSVQGIDDSEMIDLLSLDEIVMTSVNKYNESARLPSHVWFRLRSEMSGLIFPQVGGCWNWYHRQLKEAAVDRYSDVKISLSQDNGSLLRRHCRHY